jgi:protein involved in polysaccharide export with SLBB domain
MNNLKYVISFLIVLICCFAALKPALAQNINTAVTSINVNELSDAQIQGLLQQAAATGLSDNELLQTLQARGMQPDQVSLLRARIQSLRNNSSTGGQRASLDTSKQGSRKLNYKPDTLDNPKIDNLINSLAPKIFGADFFRNSNAMFEPNLKVATPQNYILGPDDQVVINIYGNSINNWNLNVSPDGNINIPGVGILNVSGLTIEQATREIKALLIKNNYRIGSGTNLTVSLGNIRSIKVVLIGEVRKPGTYTLPSVATVFNALYYSGGPIDNGSFRQIEIVRNNKVIKKLDMYDFLLKGDESANITLQDQDIIRVPTYNVRVEMDGEVKNPALFEVLPGETLQDVLRFAGGFTSYAYTPLIKVIQVSDQQRRITDIAEKDYNSYIPRLGDKYDVERIIDRFENRVTIVGAVFRPGDYELTDGMMLSQLIKDAAGLKEDAFMQRGSIIRLNPDNTTASISFNVQGIMNKTSPDIPLKREDSVSIASIFDLRDAYTVTIKGQVRQPGDFTYADSMTVEDLIIKAGGFTIGASTKRIEVARRVSNSDPHSKGSILSQVFSVNVDADLTESDINFALKPFDIVSVYFLPGYEKQSNVKIEGEVLYPGNYTIERKNERVSDIIARAGGLTASADVEGGSLKRENTLGIDKQKVDSTEKEQLRKDSLSRLKYYKSDSTVMQQPRNNYVGIDLQKALAEPGSKDDLMLEDGDVIRVPKQQEIVRVNGEVLYPSEVVFSKDESLRSYVLRAGGFSTTADVSHAYVVYPNGTVKGSSKFLFFTSHPKIKAGSEIIVPKKPVKAPLGAQEILGITSAIASLALIILYIVNNYK